MNAPIETERLILRRMEEGDFAEIASMMQDARVMYAWEYVFSDEEVREWIARMRRRYETCGYAYFLALEKSSGRAVGQIGVLPCGIHGAPQIGIGYLLKYECRGRGYALEGARACMEYAFRRLDAPFAVADIRPENGASLAVVRKLGFTLSNTGTAELIVRAVEGEGHVATTLAPGLRIAPGGTFRAEVLLNPKDQEYGVLSEHLVVVTNDPVRPMRRIRITAIIEE